MPASRPEHEDRASRVTPRSLAARGGMWSAQHRKKAIWGWLAFVVVAFMIGKAVGTKTLEHSQTGVGESGRADHAIADAAPEHAQELVLIQSTRETAGDPAFRAVAVDVERRLAALPHTQAFESPLAPANAHQISSDRHSALLRFQIAGSDAEVQDRVKPAVRAVDAVQRAHPGFTIGEFGDASTQQQINDLVQSDFGKALITSLPVTLIILLIAFGALVAAGVPLLLALTAVIATIGILGPLSHAIGGVDNSINEVILLIGLAVGVDYSMFYLRREREEREAGRSAEAALAAAAATSGRAVMVSGFTVMIAMAGMYLAGTPTFESFATGTILVVAVAMVGSLTVLPAILSWLGDRVEKGGVPIIKDQPWNAGESGVWSKVPRSGPPPSGDLHRPLRRPAGVPRPAGASACIRRTRASSRYPRTSPRYRPTTGFRPFSREGGFPPWSWSAPRTAPHRRSGAGSPAWWRGPRPARCSSPQSRSRLFPTAA
jgi:uncharacterized membrane protein YdfJ with MMPL/SSD domain